MQKCKRMVCTVLALLLIFCIAPLPAFAYGSDTVAMEPETASATEPKAQDSAPYTYTVSEDGSITITVNGQKWVLNSEDKQETVTTGIVVTQGSCLNLRTGAGLQYDIIDHLSPGTEVTVMDTVGDWYKVTISEKTGYVHGDYLKVTESITESDGLNSDLLELLLTLILQNGTTSGDTEESQPTLTPEGNLSLVDDILEKKVFTTEDGELEEMQTRLDAVQTQLDNLYQQQAAAKNEVGKVFPYEEELRSKSARLVQLDMELNMDGKKRPLQQQIAKSSRPSVLESLRKTPPQRTGEKKEKHHEEVR